MKNKIMLTVAFGCAALTFTACGDEVTEQIVQSNSGLDTVAAIDELPECTSENAGAMAFVSDSAKVYYCADSSWQLLNGKDGVDGVDGVDGANGADDKDGADGESCNAIPLKDGTGFTIICGTDTVGTLLNGEKGDQGIQGEKGDKGDKGDTGEKGEDGKDGETGVVYYCGGLVYTPTTHFCKYDEIFALCDDGAVYDPKTEFCAVSGVVTTKCGGLTFDPTTDFC